MLDPRLADQWFADSNAEDQALDRTMLSTLKKDIGPRITRLKENAATLTSEKAMTELHSLRGAVSSIGLLAAAQHMREIEKKWTQSPPATRLAKLTAAEETFGVGLEELFKRFPHLRET